METLVHEDRTFEKLVVSGQSFHGRTFDQCTFVRCDLAGADLTKSKFIDCTFTACDLSMLKLPNAGLQEVAFSECKLLGVDLSICSAMLFSVRFDGCLLDHAVLAKRRMPKTRFTKCSLKGVDFTGTDLTSGVFDNCDLQDAIFHQTQLGAADLTTAFNFRIDPDLNSLKGTRFSVDGALSLLAKHRIMVE